MGIAERALGIRAARGMWRALIVVAAAVVVAFIAVGAQSGGRASASDGPPRVPVDAPRLIIMGDSITAAYNDDPADPDQGWWSILDSRIHVEMVLSAQSGSGFVRRGHGCTGTTFFGRRHDLLDADIVIIEGGRNDWKRCTSGHAAVSAQYVRVAVDEFMDWLDGQPIRDDNVYVMTPWGSKSARAGITMTQIISSESTLHGFQFIDTSGALSDRPGRTHDGVHPTRSGSEALYRHVVHNSDIDERWGSPD